MSDSTTTDRQIATWVRADESRPFCTRPWKQIAVLSDGTAVCACIDAEKTNPLGDFATQSLDEIWNGKAYAGLRAAIGKNIDAVPICRGCPNRVAEPAPPPGLTTGLAKPRVLFLESTALCNLACPGCNRQGIEGGRTATSMDFELYKKVIDELSPDLKYMEFHIGGENYMHKRAHDMVRYCKDKNPNAFVLSSTNGHFFHTDERVEQLLDSGIDALIISVDGARQESYARYRVNGNIERVFDGVRRIRAAREARGLSHPLLIWRYILFDWNDSPEEMQAARELAPQVGFDHLAWHLNGVGDQVESTRYHVGSPHLTEIEHELWDTLPGRLDIDFDLGFGSYT